MAHKRDGEVPTLGDMIRVDNNDGDEEGQTFNYAGVSDHGMHASIIDQGGERCLFKI